MSVRNYHTINGRIRSETLSGSTTNYAPDALGSTFMTTAGSGTPRNYYRFKPYGGFVYQGGPDPDPKFLWTGATGSRLSGAPFAGQYNRARHYGREQGNWTSVDPLWPGQPAYAYVRGNPATQTDPSGKWVLVPIIPGLPPIPIPWDPKPPIITPGRGYPNLGRGLGEFPNYGNYCGSSNDACGRAAPIDCIDEACQAHDECTKAAGVSGIHNYFSPAAMFCHCKLAAQASYCQARCMFDPPCRQTSSLVTLFFGPVCGIGLGIPPLQWL